MPPFELSTTAWVRRTVALERERERKTERERERKRCFAKLFSNFVREEWKRVIEHSVGPTG